MTGWHEGEKKYGTAFFKEQSYCGVAVDQVSGRVLGLYILHPNNIGRCGHISNASYAVAAHARGRHIGEKLGVIPKGFRLKNGEYEAICPYYIEL